MFSEFSLRLKKGVLECCVCSRLSLGRSGLFTCLWVTQTLLASGSFPDEGGATFLLSRPVMLNLSIRPSLSVGCLSSLTSCRLPACCLPSPAPMACPSQPLPPTSLFNSSRSLTLCLPPLFPACLPTEDCDCEGYFNGQYIGESVHVFLHLLLPSALCLLQPGWVGSPLSGKFSKGQEIGSKEEGA